MAKTSVTNKAGDVLSTAKDNPYVQRVIEDQELRESLKDAFVAARKAYGRIADNGDGPVSAVTGDRKVKRDLKAAAENLRDATERLRAPKKRHPIRKLFLFSIVATGLVLILSESARKTVLDAIFGAEEEFTYTATTSPEDAATNGAPAAE